MRGPGEGTRIVNLKPESCAAASTRKIWNAVNTLWGFTFEREKRRLRYPPPHHPHQPPFILSYFFSMHTDSHTWANTGRLCLGFTMDTVLHLTSHVAVSHRNPSQANSNTVLTLSVQWLYKETQYKYSIN